MTIVQAAHIIGVSPKTLARWEKVGKVRKAKRDWRGWRVYDKQLLIEIRKFHLTLYDPN